MSHFVEIIPDHPALEPDEKKLAGMKGRVLTRYVSSGRVRLYLTDRREVVVSEKALRPIPKKNF